MNRQVLFWKLARAGVSGGLVAALNFSLLWVLARFLGPGLSFSLAYFLAVFAHFLLSKFWTFGDRSRALGRQVPAYLLAVVVSYLAQLLVFQACLRLPGIHLLVANALSVPAGTLVSFTMMQLWVFSSRRVPAPAENAGALAALTTPSPDPLA